MQMERKALYNLMRMNWLLDPSLPAEPWQVEDYRALPLNELFERLRAHEIDLDKKSFTLIADEVSDPEELTEMLLANVETNVVTQDQVYLLVFESWRRLIPDRPSLSLFCDELDHQIYLYDHMRETRGESIQDAVANLQVLLDENTDSGVDPHEVFQSICNNCANDIENFLYDYISDQIDNGQEAYVNELLDGFIDYVKDSKWLHLLRARVIALSDPETIGDLIRELYAHYGTEKDLDFNLELLSLLATSGDEALFTLILKENVNLLTTEEHFQDLLAICKDYFQNRNSEQNSQQLEKLLRRRLHLHPEGVFNNNDPQVVELLAFFP